MRPAALRKIQTRAAACGWRAVVLRALVLAAGWWILTEGDRSGLLFGAVAVPAALITSILLPAPSPAAWHPIGLIRFAIVFVVGSVRGGFDVASRALAPRVRIAPCVLDYTLRLPEGAARNLMLGALSLMPGTQCIACEGRRLEVHAIAPRRTFSDELADLEASIARAAGERLEERRA